MREQSLGIQEDTHRELQDISQGAFSDFSLDNDRTEFKAPSLHHVRGIFQSLWRMINCSLWISRAIAPRGQVCRTSTFLVLGQPNLLKGQALVSLEDIRG